MAPARRRSSRTTRAISRPMPTSVFDRLYSSGKIIEVGCMMHARRKFYEARTSDPPRAHQALAWIKLLYDVEREAKEKHEAEEYEAFVAARHALRGERSRPIFKQFHDWLVAEAPKVLPKSPIGEAIRYALNHWTALERPLEAGFLELDNGACERAFKPVALGRKNWLFVGERQRGRDSGRADEPVHDVQEPGDRPAGVPPRRARPDQHPPGASDRGAVARPLAGAAPGGRNREGLTTPTPRVRLCPRRARGDCVRRAHKRHRIRGSPNASPGRASCRRFVGRPPRRPRKVATQGRPRVELSSSPPPRVALVMCTAERVPRAAVIPGRYGQRAGQPTGRPWDARSAALRAAGGAGDRRRDRPADWLQRLTAARPRVRPPSSGPWLRGPRVRFKRVPRTSSRARRSA